MSLKQYIWKRLFVNNKYKRKKYDNNALYYEDRSVSTLGYMALSQLKASVVAKNSEKKVELNSEYLYPMGKHYALIDECDVVSFDIFDTLLFRPVAKPTDLFWFLEIDNHIFDFKRLRIIAEQNARAYTNKPNREITLQDIYTQFSKMHSCSIDQMVRAEEELEKKLCFRNDYAVQLYKYAKSKGKKIIAVSDMYLSSDVLKDILANNDIDIEEIYVSCETLVNKLDASMQKYVTEKYVGKRILHIGDNRKSDIKASESAKWRTIWLKNVNSIGRKYRSFIEDTLNGSIYSGIINSTLYDGNFHKKSYQYMYGLLYGGVLTIGFCQWLNSIKDNTKVDHIIFLGRDCKVIKSVYEKLYGSDAVSYMEISRMALLPLLADISFEGFLLEGFERRIDNGNSVQEVFKKVGLSIDVDLFFDGLIKGEEILSRSIYSKFKKLMYERREGINRSYRDRYNALKKYVSSFIQGNNKVCIVDLGWRGSTIMYLKEYLEHQGISTEVVGAMFGMCDSDSSYVSASTNQMFNYAFSPYDREQSVINREEICYSDIRFMLEYMYTSTDYSVLGYLEENGEIIINRENRDISVNNQYVEEIHQGIMDYVIKYQTLLGDYSNHIHIDSSFSYGLLRSCLKRVSIKDLFEGFNEDSNTVHGY